MTWKRIREYRQSKKISTVLITRKAKLCRITKPLLGTPTEAIKSYDICRKKFDEIKLNSETYRHGFLRKHINHYKANGDNLQAKQVQVLQRSKK